MATFCGSLSALPLEQERSHRQYGNETRISYDFQVSQNIILLLISPLISLKNVKTILCFVGQTRTGSWPDLAQKAKVC